MSRFGQGREGRFIILSLAVAAIIGSSCGGGRDTTTPGVGGAGAIGGTGGSGAGGSSSGACPASSATGTLSLRITGTPDHAGLVTLTGGTSVTVSTDLTLPAGSETLTAYLVGEGTDRVRRAYTPTVDVPDPCVRAGQTTTVNVSYAEIASSGWLWVGASNTPSGATLLGYDPPDVASNGTSASAVALNSSGSDGFTFDLFGNLWVTGATTADPPVARYPAAMLGTDGDKTPDIVIDSPSFDGGIPGPKVLAFDLSDNLWVSVVAANKVVRFTAAQLAASGSPTATVQAGGISAPAGIAFDAAGNMWVAANGSSTVVRLDAAHLSTSGTGADLTITARTPSPVISTLTSPLGIAFDAAGNLWVNYDGILARLTPADLAGTGTKTITPSVQLTLDVQSLPLGIAFDEFGGLWFADRAGRFACLGPSQLTGSATVNPDIVIASPDLGSAGWFALYPAPAFTPLAHALP